jgi:hypothetical protein
MILGLGVKMRTTRILSVMYMNSMRMVQENLNGGCDVEE